MSEVEANAGGERQQVQSPPRVTVVETPAEDPRRELEKLAGEVAKRGSRRLLWEYLRLRSRVMGS